MRKRLILSGVLILIALVAIYGLRLTTMGGV